MFAAINNHSFRNPSNFVNWDEIKLDPGTQIAPMGLSLRLYIGPEDIGKCDWTRHIVVYFFCIDTTPPPHPPPPAPPPPDPPSSFLYYKTRSGQEPESN